VVKKGGFPGVWFEVGIRSVVDHVGTSNAKGADRESRRQRYVTQERYVVNGIRNVKVTVHVRDFVGKIRMEVEQQRRIRADLKLRF
jgi:hypothetical protein